MNVVISHVDSTRFKLLSGLSFQCLQHILGPVLKARYKPQTNLVFPGDKIEHIYLIEKGWVKIYSLNEQGQESICSVLAAGESFMVDMLLYDNPSPVGAKTETECDLLLLPLHHMRTILKTHPEFGLKVVEDISALSRNRMHLIELITVQPALQRVGGFLLMAMLENKQAPSYEFDLPYGKSEIAHYIGLTPATFSRCLKLLAKTGICAGGRHIRLHVLNSLCLFCDFHTAQKCRRFNEQGFCRLCTRCKVAKAG